MTDKQLTMQCIQTLKKYLRKVKNFPDDSSKATILTGPDMAEWKNTG